MKKRLVISAVVALSALLAGAPLATAAPNTTPSPAPSAPASAPASPGASQTPSVTDGSNYGGNPSNEAALVAAEDKRLVQVRTVSSVARWSGTKLSVPYRVSSGSGFTLVLTARSSDYTIDDLLSLAPKTFVRQPDGAYLLSENIVVEPGATLTLSRPGGAFALELLSTAKNFVSIVNFGGKLNITGAPGALARVSSWDTDTGAPRLVTDTGRAYVRSIGGSVAIAHAAFADLGFWSGRTGGLSMTGSDRPVTGALTSSGSKATYTKVPAASKKAEKSGAPAPTPAPSPTPSLTPGQTLPDAPNATGDFSYVSASVDDTTVTDDVYGLFLANAVGVSIHGTTVQGSRMDGIVLHRFVSNAVISNTTARGSALNGFSLSRATSGVRLDSVTAASNRRDGIYIDGRSLATGPSATGTAIADYGNNSVQKSTLSGNTRYGIEVRGGNNTTIRSNTVSGGISGIVADGSAAGATIADNHLTGQSLQAIALRDGVTASTVQDNTVSGAPVGIYLRNAQAKVLHNSLSDMTSHGISAIGAAAIEISKNTVSGIGPSAVDLKRATHATATDTTGTWTLTRSLWDQLVSFFQPLTLMWTCLVLILLFTAVAGHRHRGIIRHPYARQAPMTSFTDLAPIGVHPEALQHVGPVKPTQGTGRGAHRGTPPIEADALDPVEAGMA